MSVNNYTNDSEQSPDHISTAAARRKLECHLEVALLTETNTLINAPTSLGKSYTVATTPWRDYPDITGGEPVIHLHGTRETRKAAHDTSEAAGLASVEVKSGIDLCPVGEGKYDEDLRKVHGETASDWLRKVVSHEGYTFHEAHRMLAAELGPLPCANGDGCPSQRRWDGLLRDDDGRPNHDIIHASYDFAYLDWLVDDANVIFDERPAFNDEVTDYQAGFLERSLNRWLAQHTSAMSWTNLVEAVCTEDTGRLGEYCEVFTENRENHAQSARGYLHGHTVTVGEAIACAEPTLRGRRYIGRAGDTSVVLDSQGTLQQIHRPPNLADARCVIGLDAHPAEHLWRLNTVEDLRVRSVLTPDERARWRREERGLYIVQVGRDTRPYTNGWRKETPRNKARAIIEALRREYGPAFRTSISSKAIEPDVRGMLKDAGVEHPETLYFGNLKSRNDFEGETVGLVLGCIDPGDEYILDLLALCGHHALPKQDANGNREYGREFDGPDTDIAAEFLASVREQELAQAVGRYARQPGTDAPGATVYVWSDALPDSLVDETVPGVISQVTSKKETIAQYVRREEVVTKKGVSETCGISESYTYEVLQELADQGVVTVSKGTGYNGADEYQFVEGTIERSVDLGF